MLDHFIWDGMLLAAAAAVHGFCTRFYDVFQTLNRTILLSRFFRPKPSFSLCPTFPSKEITTETHSLPLVVKMSTEHSFPRACFRRLPYPKARVKRRTSAAEETRSSSCQGPHYSEFGECWMSPWA